MSATVTVTGTWSTISTAERPVQHRDTVEQRFDYDSLNYQQDLTNNTGGFPELEQFIGAFGQGYSIPGLAAAVRLHKMLEIYLNQTRTPRERSYTP